MHKLLENICDELDKIAAKGLNTANLETAYKLIDMLKDLKNVEYWKTKEDYYDGEDEGYSQAYDRRGKREDMMMRKVDGDYNRDSSYARGRARRRDARGRYMRDYSGAAKDDYMDAKHQYRQTKDGDCKERMMERLEEYLEGFTEELADMSRDADCQEERQTIQRYVDKMRNMMV